MIGSHNIARTRWNCIKKVINLARARATPERRSNVANQSARRFHPVVGRLAKLMRTQALDTFRVRRPGNRSLPIKLPALALGRRAIEAKAAVSSRLGRAGRRARRLQKAPIDHCASGALPQRLGGAS